MQKSRMISTRIWDDDYFSNIDPIEKLLFLYFLTNSATNIAGIYEIPLKRVANETGIDKEMLIKVLSRFSRDEKIFYENGWVCLKNFVKHQNKKSPLVQIGIKNELALVPKDILEKFIAYGYGINTVSISNLIKSNLIKSKIPREKDESSSSIPLKEKKEEKPFVLAEEIKKLEASPRRDLGIIALYFESRKPEFKNKEQYRIALRRHLKPAKDLSNFTDEQIIKALEYAEKEYKDIYTLETLIKILTK